MNNLTEQLYNKAYAEQQSYISNLLKMPPEEILNHSYEKVMRDDILCIFENGELTNGQAKELLKLKEPLADCYARWLHNDLSHMDMLRDTVETFADDLVKHTAEQKRAKRKHEPER